MLGKSFFVSIGSRRIVFKFFRFCFKLGKLFFNFRNSFHNGRIHCDMRRRFIKHFCLVFLIKG